MCIVPLHIYDLSPNVYKISLTQVYAHTIFYSFCLSSQHAIPWKEWFLVLGDFWFLGIHYFSNIRVFFSCERHELLSWDFFGSCHNYPGVLSNFPGVLSLYPGVLSNFPGVLSLYSWCPVLISWCPF